MHIKQKPPIPKNGRYMKGSIEMTFEEYIFENIDTVRLSIAKDVIMFMSQKGIDNLKSEEIASMTEIAISSSIRVIRLYDQWQSKSRE